MASLTLRTVKGTPLTNAELDANFTALNTDVTSRLLASSNLSDLGNAATARTNLGLGNVENKSSATIRGELTSLNVTTALGFTPYNASNPNSYVDAPGARNAISVSGSLAYNATTGVISFTDAVTSVFGRTGAVALTQSDVTGVLGAGSITNTMLANTAVATLSGTNTGDETAATIKTKLGITTLSGSNTGDQTITLTGDVTGSGTGSFAATLAASGVTAGTYTKVTVDAKGRVTVGASLASADLPTYTGSLTSSQVTTALGFTPLSNATSYLPLAGGTLTGNLTFNGTGLRITGDFSNGTVASRTLFQTSTANSNTFVTAIPNGTAVNSQFQAYNSSDPANSSIAALVASASQVRIVSGYIGTGTLNPITFIFSNTEAARITPSTLNFLIGTSTDDGVNKLQVNGSVSATQFNGSGAGLTGTAASLTAGAVSSITSAQVTTALGFTPYNSTNPNGYITGSGNAATATSSPLLSALGNYVWSASTLPTGYNQGVQASFVSSTQGFQSYGSVVTVNTYSGGGGALQLYVPYSPTYGGTGLQVRFGNYDVSSGNSWTSWKTLLASDNYSSYTMPLSGGATWNMTYFDFNQSNTYFRITSGPGAFYIGDDDLVNLGSGAVVATPSSRIGTGVAILSTYAYASGQGDNKTHFGYYDGANYVNHIRGAATYFASSAVQLAGNQVLHAGNYTSYSPSLTGSGASGTWGINITGTAGSVSGGSVSASLVYNSGWWYTFNDGTRDANATTWYPNVVTRGVGWFFANASSVGTGGNYAGVMQFNPWTGTTASTGDASYQLAFGSTATNGGGTPQLRIRKGIDSTWNSWYDLLTSANYSSYALPLSGGVVNGQSQFVSNRGSGAYLGAQNSPSLQAYCNDSGSAFMSFHRSGLYAVNMGLDPDNVLRIGGWSASSNRLQMDMSGNLTMAGNVTAYSDERLKKDWADLPDSFVDDLAGVLAGTYTRIDSEERQAGVSAQDFQRILKEVVSTDNKGYLSLAYGNAALVASVALAKRVVSQEQRIQRLESLIATLIGD